MKQINKKRSGLRRRILTTLLVLVLTLVTAFTAGCSIILDNGGSGGNGGSGSGKSNGSSGDNGGSQLELTVDEDGSYDQKDEVALYIHTYDKLPKNYMTKNEARSLGWNGGSLEDYAEGMCIGGDYFGNRERVLPSGSYHECDIDTLGAYSRGAKRIVYDSDGDIYYTEDHYETFTQLYDKDGAM